MEEIPEIFKVWACTMDEIPEIIKESNDMESIKPKRKWSTHSYSHEYDVHTRNDQERTVEPRRKN